MGLESRAPRVAWRGVTCGALVPRYAASRPIGYAGGVSRSVGRVVHSTRHSINFASYLLGVGDHALGHPQKDQGPRLDLRTNKFRRRLEIHKRTSHRQKPR